MIKLRTVTFDNVKHVIREQFAGMASTDTLHPIAAVLYAIAKAPIQLVELTLFSFYLMSYFVDFILAVAIHFTYVLVGIAITPIDWLLEYLHIQKKSNESLLLALDSALFEMIKSAVLAIWEMGRRMMVDLSNGLISPIVSLLQPLLKEYREEASFLFSLKLMLGLLLSVCISTAIFFTGGLGLPSAMAFLKPLTVLFSPFVLAIGKVLGLGLTKIILMGIATLESFTISQCLGSWVKQGSDEFYWSFITPFYLLRHLDKEGSMRHTIETCRLLTSFQLMTHERLRTVSKHVRNTEEISSVFSRLPEHLKSRENLEYLCHHQHLRENCMIKYHFSSMPDHLTTQNNFALFFQNQIGITQVVHAFNNLPAPLKTQQNLDKFYQERLTAREIGLAFSSLPTPFQNQKNLDRLWNIPPGYLSGIHYALKAMPINAIDQKIIDRIRKKSRYAQNISHFFYKLPEPLKTAENANIICQKANHVYNIGLVFFALPEPLRNQKNLEALFQTATYHGYRTPEFCSKENDSSNQNTFNTFIKESVQGHARPFLNECDRGFLSPFWGDNPHAREKRSDRNTLPIIWGYLFYQGEEAVREMLTPCPTY